MSIAMWVAFGCNVLAVLLGPAVSVTYATRHKFMPYHGAAVGKSWSQLDPPIRNVLLALIRGVGGYGLAIALAQFIVLLIPFRHGETWALWAVPAVGLVHASSSFRGLTPIATTPSLKRLYAFPLCMGFLYLVGLCIAFLR